MRYSCAEALATLRDIKLERSRLAVLKSLDEETLAFALRRSADEDRRGMLELLSEDQRRDVLFADVRSRIVTVGDEELAA